MEKRNAAFPRPANSVSHSPIKQPVTHIPTPPTTTEKDPFLPVIHKKDFKEMIGNQERKHGLHDTRPYPLGTRHTAAGAAPLQLNTAAPQKLRGVGTPPLPQGGFFMRRRPYADRLCPLAGQPHSGRKDFIMAFFSSAVGVLQTLVIALGAGLGIWGVINLMEGYGNDNPGANAHVR